MGWWGIGLGSETGVGALYPALNGIPEDSTSFSSKFHEILRVSARFRIFHEIPRVLKKIPRLSLSYRGGRTWKVGPLSSCLASQGLYSHLRRSTIMLTTGERATPFGTSDRLEAEPAIATVDGEAWLASDIDSGRQI